MGRSHVKSGLTEGIKVAFVNLILPSAKPILKFYLVPNVGDHSAWLILPAKVAEFRLKQAVRPFVSIASQFLDLTFAIHGGEKAIAITPALKRFSTLSIFRFFLGFCLGNLLSNLRFGQLGPLRNDRPGRRFNLPRNYTVKPNDKNDCEKNQETLAFFLRLY